MPHTNEAAPDLPQVEILSSLTNADVADFANLLPQLSGTPRTEDEIGGNLQRAIDSPTSRVVVIRGEDGHIHTSATGNLCPIPTGYKPWVDDVVTDEKHRGSGHGTRAMEALHGWFKEIGVPYVNLTSTPDKESAGRLYERMGYKLRNTRVYRLIFPVGTVDSKDLVST